MAQPVLTEAGGGDPAVEALHIALATVHGVDDLVTWSMRHIAYAAPVIATPDALMGG